MIGGSKKLNRACLTVVADDDSKVRLLLGREGIAYAGDGSDELIPADLFTQIAVAFEREVFKGTAWGQGPVK
jgi:hypothetical protein